MWYVMCVCALVVVEVVVVRLCMCACMCVSVRVPWVPRHQAFHIEIRNQNEEKQVNIIATQYWTQPWYVPTELSTIMRGRFL